MNNLQASAGINSTNVSQTQHDTIKKVISRRVGPTPWQKDESSYGSREYDNNLKTEGAK